MPERTRAARAATVLLLAYVVSQINIARLLWPLSRDVVRLQSASNPRVIRDVMGAWTPAQRAQYRRHLLPDSVHPLLYGATLALAGRAVLPPSHPQWMRWAVVAAPATSGMCDLVENAFHAQFSAEESDITTRAGLLSTAVTRTKWILAVGTLAWIGIQASQRRPRT